MGPRPIATTEAPKRSPSSGKPTNRFHPAMSSGRCPVPTVGEDGGLLRTRFTSALLPTQRLRQGVLDLPSLRPGAALLQPAVPPAGLSATAAPRQQRHRDNRRHQQSTEGRLDHRDRQREYRRRRTNAPVTDQGSLRSSFRCRILLQAITPTPFTARVGRERSPESATFCGSAKQP